MTDEQKQILVHYLSQSLCSAEEAVHVYAADGDTEKAAAYMNDVKVLLELITMFN